MGQLNRWFEQEKQAADFRVVYISEAHPSDGRQVPKNERDNVLIKTHKSIDDRRAAAKRLRDDLGITIPIVLDGLDDGIAKAFQAWPDRIAIIDRDGKVAYYGRPGPAGFSVAEAAKALGDVPRKD